MDREHREPASYDASIAQRDRMNRQLEHLHQQAREHLQAKRWAQASQTYQQLLDLEIQDEDTLYSSFIAFDSAGEYEKLLSSTTRLLEQEPNRAVALAYKARALQKVNLLSEATIANDQALLLDKNLPLAWINRSGVQLLQQKFSDALRSAQRAIELAPDDARAWANKGVALLNFNSLLNALEAFDRSLACDPTNLFSLTMKSEILIKMGRLNEAVLTARQTLDIEPANVEALTYATQALRSLERYDSLQETARKLTQLKPDSLFAWENYMRGLRGSGDFEKANEVLDRVIELDPINFRFLTMKADTLCRLQRYREAVSIADRAIMLNQEYPPARRIREKALKLMYRRKKR